MSVTTAPFALLVVTVVVVVVVVEDFTRLFDTASSSSPRSSSSGSRTSTRNGHPGRSSPSRLTATECAPASTQYTGASNRRVSAEKRAGLFRASPEGVCTTMVTASRPDIARMGLAGCTNTTEVSHSAGSRVRAPTPLTTHSAAESGARLGARKYRLEASESPLTETCTSCLVASSNTTTAPYVPSSLSVTAASTRAPTPPPSASKRRGRAKSSSMSPPIERGFPKRSAARTSSDSGRPVAQFPSASPETTHLSGSHGPATTCSVRGHPAAEQSPTSAATEYAPAAVSVAAKAPTTSSGSKGVSAGPRAATETRSPPVQRVLFPATSRGSTYTKTRSPAITVAGSVTSASGSPRLSSTTPPSPSETSSARRATHALGNVGPAVTSAMKCPTSTGSTLAGLGIASATMDTSYDPAAPARSRNSHVPSPSSTASQSHAPGPVTSAASRFRDPASRVGLPKRSLRVTRTTAGSPAGQCSISLPASTRHSEGSIAAATHCTGRTRTVGLRFRASTSATSSGPALSTR